MGTFQSFWYGDRLPPYQQLALKSFIDHGHSFVLYAYGQLKVPDGVELRDAETVIPRDRIFFDQAGANRGGIAAFSDLFRFRLLLDHGGWWVDTDVVCLGTEVPEPEICLGWQDHRLVGTAIMRFPRSHPIVREVYESADRAGTEIPFGGIGPGLLTSVTKEQGFAGLLPRHAIYPIEPLEALYMLVPSKADAVRSRIGTAPLLHLWTEIFRRAAVLSWVAPPAGCYIHDLFMRHGFPVDGRYAYTADEMERIAGNFLRSMDAATQFQQAKALEREVAELRGKLAEAEAALALLRAPSPPQPVR